MKLAFLITSAAALLSACVSYSVKDDGTKRARIGQTVQVADVAVTPLEVLEDSRCPSNVHCIWPGRVRLKARIDVRGSSTEQEIVLGEELTAGSRTLKFVDVVPSAEQGRTIYTEDYRFKFVRVPHTTK